VARFTATETTRDGETTLRLQDTATGATAEIWPGCGFNCFALSLPAPDAPDTLVPVVQAPPALDEIRRRPSWWGVPLLFPFPGAIPDGAYEFGGRRLRLGRPDQPVVAEGHEAPGTRRNYHGFVMDAPWTPAAPAAGDDGVSAGAGFAALPGTPAAALLEGFPFPFRVEASYRLDAGGLRLRFVATNPGPGELPCGFGAHPFIKVPLGPGGAPVDCLVRIPAARRWDGRRLRQSLENVGPAGAAGLSEDVVRPPVSAELDLRRPKPFVEGVFNGLYTDLPRRDGWIEASVQDPVNGREAVMRGSPGLDNVVFWSPPGRQELCLEPWSCPSNVFNLAAQGVPFNGLTVLGPGERVAWEMTLGLRALAR
jgi:aldose 1-epimerase